MEFHYLAGDERCRSAGAAATSANSETAATRVPNVHVAGDGAGYHGKNLPPPASDLDELRRRAAKERIRALILREEAEAMALGAEVRREMMEERARLLAGLAGGSESLKTAAPYFHEAMSKVDVSAAVPAKRKNPDVHDTSAVLAATGSKKPKPDLTCTVCNITATSEVALQEHLGGRSHGKKAAKLALPVPGTGQPEEDAFIMKVNGLAALLAKGTNPGVVTASVDLAQKCCDNLGLNCTVCGIKATSEKSMQDHLKGKIHMRKTATLPQPYPKEDGTHLSGRKHTNKAKVAAVGVGACGNGSGSETVPMEANGVRRLDDKLFVTLRQADDSLSCGLCGVDGCDKRGMIIDHWCRARLAEEKKRASEAVNKDGNGVPVTDGAAQVDN